MIFLILFVAAIPLLIHQLYWKRRLLPPGPLPIPFVGNMLSMASPQPGYECFRRWTQQYGDVYTFWLATQPYVIISSYERLQETFIRDGDVFADKKPLSIQEKIRGGNYGVIETNGEFWRTHRRFVLSRLRDFGMGRDLMQQRILTEVEEMLKTFDRNIDNEQNVTKIMEVAVANVINQLVFGYRFEKEKAAELTRLQNLLESQEEGFKSFKIMIQAFVPLLSKILPGPSVDEYLDVFKTEFYGFFNQKIDEHRQKIDYDSDESSDYAEAYLKEQKRREAEGDFETFSDRQLSNVCLDLWLAGLATTSTTLSWAVAYLMNVAGVQERIHAEMDREVGSRRLITMDYKSKLVYMNAFINESQRCANIVPLNLFHSTTRDTVIGGFAVPKGTGVIAQISTVMLDEKVFPDPYTFNPDRFIENGKLKKVEQLVPFSIGKRQCLGEGLAKMELFLFLANILNQYEISPSSEGPPSIDKSLDFAVTTRRFNAYLKPRKI